MIKLGLMVLKGANWVNNTNFRSYGLEMESIGYTYDKIRSNGLERSQVGVHSDKMRCNGLERSQFGIHKNQVISS